MSRRYRHHGPKPGTLVHMTEQQRPPGAVDNAPGAETTSADQASASTAEAHLPAQVVAVSIGRSAGRRRPFRLVLPLLIVAVLVATGLSHAVPGARPVATTPLAAIVNGLPVPRSLYLQQLQFAEQGYSGPPVVAGSATARTLHRLQVDHAVLEAIAEVLIVHTAAAHRITASNALVAEQVARMQQAAGGAAAYAAQLRRTHMTGADVQSAARLTVLRTQLATLFGRADWLDQLVDRATITYFVGDGALPPDQMPEVALGHPAPPFVASDVHGAAVSLAQFAGHPVVLGFWAINAAFSLSDLRLLAAYARTHPAVVVIALDSQDARADVALYTSLYARDGIRIWSDPSAEAAASYTVSEPPATFFIDRAGVLRSYNFGPLADETALDQQVAHAVAGTNNTAG
jgi:peroxiredoxin